MEALQPLANGADGVREAGNAEYVNFFFDFVDDDVSTSWRENSTLTPGEIDGLDQVQKLLRAACDTTPQICSDAEFIASGWPECIRPQAADTLRAMQQRGRFSEDHEE
jgi:hypothetical protein